MNKVDTGDLKPCPFCGGEAILTFGNICDVWATCSKCDTEGPWREAETDAITAWNTRADDINLQTVLAYESGQQSMQAEIERLREALSRAHDILQANVITQTRDDAGERRLIMDIRQALGENR